MSRRSKEPVAWHQDGLPIVELEQSLPLLTFTTRYAVNAGPTSVDLFGMTGDLSGARLRLDIRPDPVGGQLVLRTSQAFDRASFVIRQLYRLEPLFEYGVNVGLALLVHQGVKLKGPSWRRADGRHDDGGAAFLHQVAYPRRRSGTMSRCSEACLASYGCSRYSACRAVARS